MKLRSYCDGDTREIVSLVNEAHGGSYEFIPRTEPDVRARLTGASCLLLAVDEQDRITGFAHLRQNWDGETLTLAVCSGVGQEEIADPLIQTSKSGEAWERCSAKPSFSSCWMRL